MNICFIPARYESSRLPGKPLLKINDKTIINLVYEQVKKCKLIDKIIILTDSSLILNEVNNFGGYCEIINEECLNGTERIVKFIKKNLEHFKHPKFIINVQGDEPYINPDHIDTCIQNYTKCNKFTKCSTLHYKINDYENLSNRSMGKLVLDKYNNIMYASRNIIPGTKKSEKSKHVIYYGHIGIFVFNKDLFIK